MTPYTARTVPQRYQSTSVAVITGASYMGTAFAFGVAPSIITATSWEVCGVPAVDCVGLTVLRVLCGADCFTCSVGRYHSAEDACVDQ